MHMFPGWIFESIRDSITAYSGFMIARNRNVYQKSKYRLDVLKYQYFIDVLIYIIDFYKLY